MASISLDNASKIYGEKTVVDGVSLKIEDGEFVAVLGPSGCGKTTLLRLIAGFETLDGGVVRLGDNEVSTSRFTLPSEKREIGIVFQNYALWPHMSVADNVGYALKIAGVNSAERARRSLDALDTVGMRDMAARAPSDLSGGQRQRVALARCLASHPTVMLLDEPLANLDVHLRASMERQFLDFHRRTGATMFYITHDQAEAMALADRIAVMDSGRLVQFARPQQLYREPQDEMVARFIGNGLVLPAGRVGPTERPGHAIAEVFGQPQRVRSNQTSNRAAAKLSVHPGDLALAGSGEDGFAGVVERVVYRGSHQQVDFHPRSMPELALSLHAPLDRAVEPGAEISVLIDDGWVIPAAA